MKILANHSEENFFKAFGITEERAEELMNDANAAMKAVYDSDEESVSAVIQAAVSAADNVEEVIVLVHNYAAQRGYAAGQKDAMMRLMSEALGEADLSEDE